ncbi:peptidoglycan DD-metalloendopeptidase family protein [Bacillaceae bacterium]
MEKGKGKALSALGAVTLALTLVSPAVGQAVNAIDRLTQEIEALQRAKQEEAAKAAAVQKEISDIRTQQKEIHEDIMAIDLQMNETQAKIDRLDKEIAQTKRKAKEAARQLAAAEKRVKERDALLKSRVKMMYESGNISYLEVLLGAKGFGDFIQRLQALKLIVDSDTKILEENKKDRDLIAAKKREIETHLQRLEGLFAEAEALKAQLQEQRKRKTVAMAALKEKEGELEEIKEEHEQAVLQLAAQAKAKLGQREALRAQLIARARAARGGTSGATGSAGSGDASAYQGGALAWPVPGYTRISSGFGTRSDPFTGSSASHNGIDIPAPEGTAIVAAEGGQVLVAGYVRGYGNCVVIDHGNGLSTLYGHIRNGGIKVSVGQVVSRGEKIAEVGSTGRSTGNHLHFGVYKNNSAVNPLSYLR